MSGSVPTAAGARTGVWFLGARGSVATTAAVGALALADDLVAPTGLVTSLPGLADAGLPGVGDLVLGGHDVTATPLAKRAEQLADGGVFPRALVRAVTPGLEQVDGRLRQVVAHSGESQRGCAARIEADLHAFREDNGLDRVVVVDLLPTRPLPAPHPGLDDLDALEVALDGPDEVLPASSLYSYAAFRAGCPVVEFTPGPGPRLPALQQLAEQQGLPWAGSDGKTGETLVKAALAPMFAARALRVTSWAAMNILGGGDGAALADPGAMANKAQSKGRVLPEILGYDPEAPVVIQNVADMGDWKTAWDNIAFEGFLGTRMTMQFTWQGCDSTLAAPLVLDLARLLAAAHAAGRTGPQPALGFFFKDPVGTGDHRVSAQLDALLEWAGGLR
ncbi:inositol-3-phosphate synthase [Aquipuribacter hungaricus]|uniref:Inositol-3-phosphate synthase n=1 Tax=Aquipuribacter hungaricus TaxID=545624 RepID=A0ABV7WDC5_9MICO